MSALAAVEFKPTPEDAVATTAALSPRHWGRWEPVRIVVGGVVIMLAALIVIAAYDWRRWGLWILQWQEFAAFTIGGLLLGGALSRRKARALSVDSPLLMRRKVGIEKDVLHVQGQGFDTRIDWRSVKDIDVRNNILLFRTSWGEAHAVPRRAFAGDVAADAFEATAREAWRGRGGGLDTDRRDRR